LSWKKCFNDQKHQSVWPTLSQSSIGLSNYPFPNSVSSYLNNRVSMTITSVLSSSYPTFCLHVIIDFDSCGKLPDDKHSLTNVNSDPVPMNSYVQF